VTTRARLAILAAVVLVAVLGAGGYLWWAGRTGPRTGPPPATYRDHQDQPGGRRAEPHLVFRSTALGDGYGRVALAPLARPDGPREVTSASCDRVYATGSAAICLASRRGLVTSYTAQLLGPDWAPRRDLPLTGIPSRARLSADGGLVATTTFVFGDSYASPGQFSTRTVVSRASGEVLGDLERFPLVVAGKPVGSADRNLWGVTFADGDRFYATAASGRKTWLVQGSLSVRRLTALREDAECPSLSPDGTRIAFKKHGDLPPGRWRLAVYDLATGRETPLAEQRSVDDQVEWLDDGRIIYGLPRGRDATAASDVWQVPADGTGTPQLLVHDAWSPAVVR
jgi:hypothetical protein